MVVTLSDRADRRLDDIASYIEERTGFPRRAARFAARLSKAALGLGNIAPSRQVFYVSAVTGYAFCDFPYRGYRIIFTIEQDLVIIIDFFDTAQGEGFLMRSLEGFRP